MSFLLSNFIELGNDELRKVNGGAASCGGGGTSGSGSGSGSSGGSSYGNSGSGSTQTVTGGSGSCGGSSGSSGSGSGSSGSSYSESSSGGSTGGSNYGGSGNCSGGTSGGSSGGSSNNGSTYGSGSGYNPSSSGNNSSSTYYGGSGNCNGSTSSTTTTSYTNDSLNNSAKEEASVNLVSLGNTTNLEDGVKGLPKNKFRYTNKTTMQFAKDNPEINESMNGGREFSKVGCKMTGASKIQTEVTGIETDPKYINDNFDTNGDGLITRDEITDGIQESLPSNYKVTSKTINNPTVKDLESIKNDESSLNYMLVKATDVAGGDHWVQGTGYYTNSEGITYIEYSPTSQNDSAKNRAFTIDSVPEDSVNVHQVTAIEVYSIVPTN